MNKVLLPKRKAIKAVIVLMLLLCIPYLLYQCLAQTDQSLATPFYIFESIDECRKIEENKSSSAVITPLLSAEKDKYIGTLSYEEFYGIQYCSDEFDFVLYAYRFCDMETAKTYFCQHQSHRERPQKDQSFFGSGNFSNFALTVFCGENAYTVYSNTDDEVNIRLFLGKAFSKTVK